jgi:DNA polymerase-3 subunit delta
MLVAHLGGDRMLSRAEIRKLCLYALSTGSIGVEDVEATIVDSASLAVDDIVDSAATGDAAALVVALRRAVKEGLDPGMVAGAALRHFQALEGARIAVDGGVPAREAVDGMRPPVFFKRKDKVGQAVSRWTATDLARAQDRLAVTVRDARLNAALGHDILADTLLAICGNAARRRG